MNTDTIGAADLLGTHTVVSHAAVKIFLSNSLIPLTSLPYFTK